ncbi:MAG: hypothetical protein IJ115_05585 [Erysipelotrichaceae bacterium]|nr:hypothetical protein [Erysipelotrichaceae bacterium]
MGRKTTTELDKVLGKLNPDLIQDYLNDNKQELFEDEKPFSKYMKEMFKAKGFSQQEVFIRADMPERYGYKIIAGDKHTVKRDVMIRLAIASKFNLKETNRALKLYGFNELYSKIARDAVVIVAINSGIYNIDQVNELLRKNGFEELYSFEIY